MKYCSSQQNHIEEILSKVLPFEVTPQILNIYFKDYLKTHKKSLAIYFNHFFTPLTNMGFLKSFEKLESTIKRNLNAMFYFTKVIKVKEIIQFCSKQSSLSIFTASKP